MAQWLSGSGIEIGALHRPLTVPEGVFVRYVDRLPESGLREQYPELKDESFAPVSLIGNAQDLSALPDDSVDFVIANHLFEHLDNPIKGLEEMVRVIRPGGFLYLALPEPRVTFDRDRTPTSVEHVLDEYRNGSESTKEAHFVEWVEKVEPNGADVSAADRKARVAELLAMDYSIHYHVWRPDTFMDFLAAARAVTGIKLELADFAPCNGESDNEFIFVLAKGIAEVPRPIPRLPAAPDSVGSQVAPMEMCDDDPTQPHPEPGGSMRHFKRSVAISPIGPLLRPIYRAGVRLLRGRWADGAP